MLGLMELCALGFASYRATQFLVHDTLPDPLRARIENWYVDGIRPERSNRARSFIRDLVSCTYCLGFWTSVVTVLVYLTATGGWAGTPLLVHAVECWTVAGIQALLNRWDDSLSTGGH